MVCILTVYIMTFQLSPCSHLSVSGPVVLTDLLQARKDRERGKERERYFRLVIEQQDEMESALFSAAFFVYWLAPFKKS